MKNDGRFTAIRAKQIDHGIEISDSQSQHLKNELDKLWLMHHVLLHQADSQLKRTTMVFRFHLVVPQEA